MSNLQANLTEVEARFGNFNSLRERMMTWYDARQFRPRPKRAPPSVSVLYDLKERNDPPKSDTLRYLCFWLLHGRVGREYDDSTWASAAALAVEMSELPAEIFWHKHGAIVRGLDTVKLYSCEATPEARTFDLIGVGALNIDTVVRVPDQRAIRDAHFDIGLEHVVTRAQYEAKLKAAAGWPSIESLGGSAFNVIQALSFAAPSLKLGYVGCLGKDRLNQFDSWFQGRDVDNTHVKPDPEALTSASLSLIESGERTLFTTEGDANERLSGYMKDNYALIDYLARARVIHISSIFDKLMPAQLLELIAAVKARSAAVKISFDPGWVWCERMESDPALQGLLKQADILFLNPKEFEKLAGSGLIAEEDGARQILPRCSEGAAVLVYKHATRTSLYSWDHNGCFSHQPLEHRSLSAQEIVDSTGAGDVLAAGILTRSLFDHIDYDKAMRLATAMVEIKLRTQGASGFYLFEGLLSEILAAGDGGKR